MLPVKILFLLSLAINIPVCEKENIFPASSASELLTNQVWILNSYGYDENQNGQLDPAEEMIQDCEKDNLYFFRLDGSGSISENSNVCSSGLHDQCFTWKLIDNEKLLDFEYGTMEVVKLDQETLILAGNPQCTTAANYMIVLRH